MKDNRKSASYLPVASNLYSIPRLISKPKKELLCAEDVATHVRFVAKNPDEHTRNLVSEEGGLECRVCGIAKHHCYFNASQQKAHHDVRVCRYCTWRIKTRIDKDYRIRKGLPPRVVVAEPQAPPIGYSQTELKCFVAHRKANRPDKGLYRQELPKGCDEGGYYGPGFANLSSGWYLRAEDNVYAAERDAMRSWWNRDCDAVLEWFLLRFGVFIMAADAAIERELKSLAPSGQKIARYLHYFLFSRILSETHLWNIYAKDVTKRLNDSQDCLACGVRQQNAHLHPSCVAWSNGVVLPLCNEHWKTLMRALSPSVPHFSVPEDYSHSIRSILGTHTCPVCEKQHSWKDLTYTYTKGFYSLPRVHHEICFHCLDTAINRSPRKTVLVRDLQALHRISQLVNELPHEDMYRVNTEQAGDLEVATRIVHEMHSMKRFEQLKRKHGSWFAVLVKSGCLPEGSRRETYGTRVLAKDGHECLSMAEKRIDDLMHARGIKHEKELCYPDSELICDWRVQVEERTYFVEYYGLVGQKEYDRKILKKRRLALSAGITLIEIYPEDLKRLETLFDRVLR